MTSQGTVFENGELGTGPVFEDPFYAVGLPLTPAFWAEVKVNDVKQDVLIQCFERRCLTFTPDNDPAWQVESGNIGQHYYHWRYNEIDRDAVGSSFTAVPQARTHIRGDDRVILVTVYDEDGEPRDGVPVTGEVTFTSGEKQEHLGIQMTGTSGDHGDGQVYLSYTGEELGQDNITVSVAGVPAPKVLSSTWVRTRAEIPDDQDDDDFDPPEPAEPGDPRDIDLAHEDGDTTRAGDPHTVIATVTDEDGNPVEDGTEIAFDIDGPNSEESGTATTDDGIATFTYTGTTAGTDTITAVWDDTAESDPLDVTIEPGPAADLILSHLAIESNPPVPASLIYIDSHTVVGVVEDEYGNAVPDEEVDFWVEGDNDGVEGHTELPTDEPNRARSNDDGTVMFTYSGTSAGEDQIFGQLVSENGQEIIEFVNMIWLDLRVTAGSPGGDESHTGTPHGIQVTVEYQDYDNGTWHPLENALVSLAINGDNAGAAGFDDTTHQTDQNGLVTVDYTGPDVGQDTISATLMANQDDATPFTDDTSVDWFTWTLDLDHASGENDTNPINTSHIVEATVAVDGNGPVEGVELTFAVSGDANPNIEGETGGDAGNTGSTGTGGTLAFAYDGGEVSGQDVIEASVSDDRAGGQVSPADVTKTWVDYGIAFDHQRENIYFTGDEIQNIETLFTDHNPGGDPSAFWQEHLGEPGPNQHSVEVSVTENGDVVQTGNIAVSVDRDETLLYEDPGLQIQGGTGTFSYTVADSGEENIVATFGQYSNETTKTWIPLEGAEYDQQATYVFVSVDPDDPTVDDSAAITITVIDQFGQPIDGLPVDVGSDTQGTIDGDGDCPDAEIDNATHHCTDADGKIVIGDHQSEEDGDETITISASGAGPVDTMISWGPGEVDSVELTVAPTTQTVGEHVTLSATVYDQHDNEIPNASVQFDTDRSGDAIDNASTGTNGEAAEVTDHTQTIAGSEEITATSDGETSSGSTITWEAGPLSQSHFLLAHSEGDLDSTPIDTEDTNVAGTDHTVYARVTDEYGNPIDTNVAFTVSGNNDESGDAPVSQETGIASFTYTSDGNAGSDTITALVGDTSAANQPLTKHWIASDAYQIVLEHQDESVENSTATNTVGEQHTVTATIEDEYGNVLENYAGSLEFEVTDQNGGDTVVPNQNSSEGDYNRNVVDGVATFVYTWYTAETHSITVVDSGLDLEPESLTKVWEADEPHTIELAHTEDDPENVVGTQHSVTASVVDQHGNVIDDWDQGIEFFVDGDSIGSDTDVENGQGEITYTGPTEVGKDEVTAESGALNSNTLTKSWVAGDAHEIQLSHTNEDPENVVGTQHSVTATVVDEYENTVTDFDGDIQLVVNGSDEGSPVTASGGTATLSYDGPTTTGQDDITAESGELDSNTLTKTWVPGDVSSLALEIDPESQSTEETVDLTATVEDQHGNPIPDIGVTFTSDVGSLNQDVDTESDGTATIEDYDYDGQTGLTETITVKVDELDTSGDPVTGTIDWWEPGVATNVEFGDCNAEFDGQIGYCHITVTVTDGGGEPVEGATVEFEITEGWTSASGQQSYVLREFNPSIAQGNAPNEQTRSETTDDQGEAIVVHRAHTPEDGHQVTIDVRVLDDQNAIIDTDQLTHTWSAIDTFVDNVDVEVFQQGSGTQVGTLGDQELTVIGRYARLEVTVRDDENETMSNIAVSFDNDANVGRFADPTTNLDEDTDGVNPFEDVLADDQGVATAIFRLADDNWDNAPVTTEFEVSVHGVDESETGDIRFVEFSAPQTPTDLTATAAGHDQIDLTWNDSTASSEVDEYEIQRSLDGSSNWTQIDTTSDTSHSDTGLDEETTYDYRVRGTNATGSSDWSNVASATTQSEETTEEDLTRTPTTGVSTAEGAECGTAEWTNPGNAADGDSDTSAQTTIPAGDISECLEVTGFGFDIPTGADIQGIEVEISRAGHGGQIEDSSLYLLNDGDRVGENKREDDDTWSSSDHEWTYGSVSDTWDESWEPDDINDEDGFGVSISAKNTHPKQSWDAEIYWVRITVHYTD